MGKKSKRYIYDPIYGPMYFPNFIWDVIPCPELQRLREIRLCNTNSLCLTGGANINRFEHAIGTCYLAQECLKSWPFPNYLSKQEEKQFLLSALLHDVTSAAFGHSVEYIESRYGFDHEKAFEYVASGGRGESYQYKSVTYEPIFFGAPRELSSKISKEDIKAIGNIVEGKGRLGPLINSTIDLDNIDNVFRLAYHIGIVKNVEPPLRLAKSLWVENGNLTLRNDAISLVEEWHKVRKKLYTLLLLNPEEFSIKCMLSHAMEIAKKDLYPLNWYYADYELLEKLSNVSSETSMIISRLMKGDLYGCIGIFSTTRIDKYETFTDTDRRRELELDLSRILRVTFPPSFKSALVVLHPIIDVNKTERQVCIRTKAGDTVQVGNSSKRLLIGVFIQNMKFNIYNLDNMPDEYMNRIRHEVCLYLSNYLEDNNLEMLKLYGELIEFE